MLGIYTLVVVCNWKAFDACGGIRVVVTANPIVMVEEFVKEYLGAKKVLGTELEVDEKTRRATGFVKKRECVMVSEKKRDAVLREFCDSLPDLGLGDRTSDHPLLAVFKVHLRVEASNCICPDYMSNQFDINDKMRAILIDWLVEVHYKFELMEETLYLTVNIIDRFLSRQAVVRKKIQLVGVTAMLLACKYEEVYVPVVDDLVTISDRAYTRGEVLDMEKLIAKTLQFNMSVPTPFVFLKRFRKAAESDRKLELLSSFIIEISLVEYQMLKFQPSPLAAAAIYTAQCSHEGFKFWTKTCEQYTMYTEDQLLECS